MRSLVGGFMSSGSSGTGNRWGVVSVLSEGLRGVRGNRRGTVIVFLVVAVSAILSIVIESQELQRLRDEELAAWREGSHVLLAELPSDIDGGRCERLASGSPQVIASGGLRASETIQAANLGNAEIRVSEATPGLTRLVATVRGQGWSPWESGLTVSDSSADQLGLHEGETIVSRAGQHLVVGDVVDLALLPSPYSSGALGGVPASGGFDYCLVLAAPGHRQRVRSYVVGTVGGTATPEVRDLTVVPEPSVLGARQSDRSTRWVGLGSGIVCLATWSALMLGRRPEAGLYRSLDMSLREVTLMRTVEFAAVAGAGLGVGTALGAGLATGVAVNTDLALYTAKAQLLAQGGTMLVAMWIPSLLSSMGQGIDLVKEN